VTRRPVLPGASELFRRTDTPADEAEVTELPSTSALTSSPALRARRDDAAEPLPGMPLTPLPGGAAPTAPSATTPATTPAMTPPGPLKRGRPARSRAERTRHDEKITVYISADELVALESARLALRAAHGVAADRGRIVREAISVLLADLTEHGENSVLVRRLKA
jgi:hypothetical protein